MSLTSEQDFTKLLAYQQVETDEHFVEQIKVRVTHKQKLRHRILALSGLGAAFTTAILVGLSNVSNWEAIGQLISQSPMLLTSAIIVGLLSGLLIRAEET